MRILLFLVATLLMSCGNSAKQDKATTTGQEAAQEISADLKVETLVLPVEGMTCEGCEATVKKTVESMDGVKSVVASHTAKTATIEFYEGKMDVDEVKEAISAAGYEVIEENKTE